MFECCCGKIKIVASDDDENRIVINGIEHERRGSKGAFCGPIYEHTIRDLERKIEDLESRLTLTLQTMKACSDAEYHQRTRDIPRLKADADRMQMAINEAVSVLENGRSTYDRLRVVEILKEAVR